MPKTKSTAMQVVVYDLGNNPLPDRVVREVENSIQRIVQQHTTLAHTVVTE